MKILLDTSIVIDFLRRKDKQKTLFYQVADEELYVSIISHTELYAGRSVWEKKEAQAELEELFSGLVILPLETRISQKAGSFKMLHTEISLLDCIIGATAFIHKLEIATLNVKDFRKMEQIRLFKR